MKKYLVFCLTTLLVSGLVQLAVAQGDDTTAGTRPQRAGGMGMFQMQNASGVLAALSIPSAVMLTGDTLKLELTVEQTTAITAAYADYQKLSKKSLAELSKAYKELRIAVTTRDIDATILETKYKATRTAEDAVIALNVSCWAKYREILTADQLALFSKAELARLNRSGGRGGNRGGNMGSGRQTNQTTDESSTPASNGETPTP